MSENLEQDAPETNPVSESQYPMWLWGLAGMAFLWNLMGLAVFIAQAMGIDLSISAQISIVLTALLASIGTAAVPGAGIVMLVVTLESIGVPSTGIALILGVDRILDMLRTVTNVTSATSSGVTFHVVDDGVSWKLVGK